MFVNSNASQLKKKKRKTLATLLCPVIKAFQVLATLLEMPLCYTDDSSDGLLSLRPLVASSISVPVSDGYYRKVYL